MLQQRHPYLPTPVQMEAKGSLMQYSLAIIAETNEYYIVSFRGASGFISR